MSPRLTIVDTSVVVAGLLTSDARSPVARILDRMLIAAFPYAVSDALLAEYAEVLDRPKVRAVHRLSRAEVDAVLTALAQHAIVLAPPRGPAAPDPGDRHLWDLLAARRDARLVTGDKKLALDDGMRGRVLLPRDFLVALDRGDHAVQEPPGPSLAPATKRGREAGMRARARRAASA